VDDLELLKSGGESGRVSVVVISSPDNSLGLVKERVGSNRLVKLSYERTNPLWVNLSVLVSQGMWWSEALSAVAVNECELEKCL